MTVTPQGVRPPPKDAWNRDGSRSCGPIPVGNASQHSAVHDIEKRGKSACAGTNAATARAAKSLPCRLRLHNQYGYICRCDQELQAQRLGGILQYWKSPQGSGQARPTPEADLGFRSEE